jgi:hypothetical protein
MKVDDSAAVIGRVLPEAIQTGITHRVWNPVRVIPFRRQGFLLLRPLKTLRTLRLSLPHPVGKMKEK